MLLLSKLNSLVEYNPKTGKITSKISRPGVAFGAEMGTIRKSNGYLQICLDKKLYYAHRLAMLLLGHDIDGAQIDHIDGNKLNNAESNLRICRNYENIQNIKGPNKTNKLGVLGVSKAGESLYRARIHHSGMVVRLGIFETIEEASAAYLAAKRTVHAFNTL